MSESNSDSDHDDVDFHWTKEIQIQYVTGGRLG